MDAKQESQFDPLKYMDNVDHTVIHQNISIKTLRLPQQIDGCHGTKNEEPRRQGLCLDQILKPHKNKFNSMNESLSLSQKVTLKQNSYVALIIVAAVVYEQEIGPISHLSFAFVYLPWQHVTNDFVLRTTIVEQYSLRLHSSLCTVYSSPTSSWFCLPHSIHFDLHLLPSTKRE